MSRLAIFDCDGTLVDGQADVCYAMSAAFAAIDAPQPDLNEVRRIVGLSLPVAIRSLDPGLDDDRARAAVQHYKDAYFARRQEGLLQEPLYDGIRELLENLRAGGWQLAVATGKSDRGLHACLTEHGIIDMFVSLQTADRHPSKPHPAMVEAALFEAGVSPAEAVMIGDTSFDMEMAREARVRAIGVAWGYHAPAELTEAGAEAVARTPADLGNLL